MELLLKGKVLPIKGMELLKTYPFHLRAWHFQLADPIIYIIYMLL